MKRDFTTDDSALAFAFAFVESMQAVSIDTVMTNARQMAARDVWRSVVALR